MTVDELRHLLASPTITPRIFARIVDRSEPTIRKGIRQGHIPSFAIADTENIPTAWVRRVLQIDEAEPAPALATEKSTREVLNAGTA